MRVGDYCTRDVATIGPDAPVREAAALMHERAVGSLAVVDADGALIGILTDRDLCLRALAPQSGAPHAGAVRAVMSEPVETLDPDEDVDQAARRMRNLGVRRLPVCRDGRLVGMLALDDLLELCTHALHDLSVETRERRQRSARESRGEHPREELEELYEVLRERLRYARWAAQEELLTDWDALKAKVKGILGLG